MEAIQNHNVIFDNLFVEMILFKKEKGCIHSERFQKNDILQK